MTGFASIDWREPLWLLLALQPVIVYLCIVLARKLQHDQFAEISLLPWVKLSTTNNKQSLIRKSLIIIAWFAFAISMAGPRTASKVITKDPSSFTNVVVLLDVSRSMTAHDIHPTRLERAKLELLDLVQRSQRERIAIVLYAANAHLIVPLTSDKNLLRHYIASISPDILPTRGSNLEGALQAAYRYLEKTNKSPQAILLISDGDSPNLNIEQYENLLSTIKENNISIYSLIAGTNEGAPILDGQSGWLNVGSQDVISRAQPELLKQIALRTNGAASQFDDADKEWQHLYDNGLSRINPAIYSNKINSDLIIWHEHYAVFLIIGIISFIFANLNLSHSGNRSYIFGIVLFSVIISGLVSSKAFANDIYQQAYQAYQNKDYQQADEQFSKINSYAGRIGQASTAYQNKNYPKAIMLFIQSSLEATTDQQRVHALFNLANSYYQLEKYQQAADIYRDVLRYQTDFPQAKVNLDFALSLIKKQRKQPDPTDISRGGKGPRTAMLSDDIDLGKGNLTLGDEEESPYTLPKKESINGQQTDLSSAGLVTQNIESGEDTTWTYQIQTIEELTALNIKIKSDEPVFWQRLFEWEEGFPAPLKEPLTVPGVQAW